MRSFATSQKSSKIIWLTALSVVGLFLWAGFAEIDQISRASGQVIPAGRVQQLQNNDGGIIKEIRVREGARVKRGQILVVLDQVKLAAGVKEAQSRVAAYKSEKIRIEAELFGRPLQFSKELQNFPEFISNQRALYARRRAAHTQDIAALQKMRTLLRRELEMNKPLLAYGDVSQAEVLRLERAVADIEGQIATRQNKYLVDLQTQETQINQELASAEQLLTQRQAALKEAVLVAPTDGIIKNIRTTTIGGVLRPGDQVMEIVPTGDQLIVEARVSPSDIAYVHVGQSANLKFDAYDPSIFGSALGTVIYVSPDTLVERGDGNQAVDRVYYRVHISVDTKTMHVRDHEPVIIQPGMTAVAEIKTGRNTVLNFLLKPITKTLSNSFGER